MTFRDKQDGKLPKLRLDSYRSHQPSRERNLFLTTLAAPIVQYRNHHFDARTATLQVRFNQHDMRPFVLPVRRISRNNRRARRRRLD